MDWTIVSTALFCLTWFCHCWYQYPFSYSFVMGGTKVGEASWKMVSLLSSLKVVEKYQCCQNPCCMMSFQSDYEDWSKQSNNVWIEPKFGSHQLLWTSKSYNLWKTVQCQGCWQGRQINNLSWGRAGWLRWKIHIYPQIAWKSHGYFIWILLLLISWAVTWPYLVTKESTMSMNMWF